MIIVCVVHLLFDIQCLKVLFNSLLLGPIQERNGPADSLWPYGLEMVQSVFVQFLIARRNLSASIFASNAPI